MNRFEKVEFLQETCAEGIVPDNSILFDALVQWMPESEFEEFYDNFCQVHDIHKTNEELDAAMFGDIIYVGRRRCIESVEL